MSERSEPRQPVTDARSEDDQIPADATTRGRDRLTGDPDAPGVPPTEDRPVPGVKHVEEPDAENVMPAEDRPGTL
jgi:hypothetical protein